MTYSKMTDGSRRIIRADCAACLTGANRMYADVILDILLLGYAFGKIRELIRMILYVRVI